MKVFNKILLNAALFVCMVLTSNYAVGQAFPVLDGKVHNGVATCSSSMCHGSVKEYKNSNILHNEYTSCFVRVLLHSSTDLNVFLHCTT